MRQDIELTLLDLRTSYLSGKTLRLYEGALPADFQAVPAGTRLAALVIHDPSHNAASWNSELGRAEAVMRSTWADQTADASGTFGCFTVTDDATGSVVQRGTAGISGSGAQLIVSAASIAAGAPFSITAWTFRHPPMP